MIRTVLEMVVRDGCQQDFERVWQSAATVASRYPGAGLQTMLRDPEAPLRYTITADWDTREHLAVYQQSPDRQALSAVLDHLRESATKSLHEVVAHVPAPAKEAPTKEGTAYV
ncbi:MULTISPECIES: antibiotic biosynthesis monooxygenase family protein [Streptomyces]|uniref:Antibiotic biosynthesis monooxygenase family protein n=2 Tax=Streptomyces TaxID=1883 RepID=A0ABV9J3C6_9ACTN